MNVVGIAILYEFFDGTFIVTYKKEVNVTSVKLSTIYKFSAILILLLLMFVCFVICLMDRNEPKCLIKLASKLRPRSELVPVPKHGARAPCLVTKMDIVQTRQCPELKMFINN